MWLMLADRKSGTCGINGRVSKATALLIAVSRGVSECRNGTVVLATSDRQPAIREQGEYLRRYKPNGTALGIPARGVLGRACRLADGAVDLLA